MNTRAILKACLATALAASFAPASAAGKDADGAKKEQKKQVNEKGEPLICKKVRFTGSRLAQDSCATAAEWKEIEAEEN